MLSPNEPLPPDFTYKIPADLKRVLSFTTLRVLEDGISAIEHEPERDGKFSEGESDGPDKELLKKILSRPDMKPKDEQEKKNRMLYEKPSLDISLNHVSPLKANRSL
jgi:hypothetical protein